ncbi:MAG TPA: hypothetical protein VFV41_20595, partial [Streptosporangiaceae bacterium]|nr:hypothetical protein [Streptosporangiaceae bacterium]
MTTGPAEGGPARDSAGGAAGDPAGGAAAGLASRAAGAQAALRPGAPAPPPGARRVAAIDCGTNSLRLLIADVDPARGELRDLSRRMEIVRLGQGVDATGRIAPDALARTLGVLQEYARAIRQTGATATRMVATSATRDATNAAEFVSGVVGILGVPPEVVSGAAEARLSFTGATTELARSAGRPGDDLPGPYLVIDIGGGSTEFVVGGRGHAAAGPAAARPAETSAAVPGPGPGPGSGSGPGPQPELRAISMDIGCVRMTERHLHHDPPTEAEVAAATADIAAAIDAAAH